MLTLTLHSLMEQWSAVFSFTEIFLLFEFLIELHHVHFDAVFVAFINIMKFILYGLVCYDSFYWLQFWY